MSLQLRATKHQLEDLKRLAELGPAKLEEIQAEICRSETASLRPQDLLVSVGKVVDAKDAERVVRQLLSIQGVVRQSGLELSEVLSGIQSAVERQGSDVGFKLTDWQAIEDRVKSLVGLKSVRLIATAIELAYDYANLLKRTKVLTDIRPLYDESGGTIEGAVVSYTLRLRYDSADGEHELSIALDESDINSLIAQCERALRKAASARTLMTEKCNISVTVSGEANDA
jgi:hypothetical protein